VYKGYFISTSGIFDLCGRVAGMVTPKGSLPTEGETLQVSVCNQVPATQCNIFGRNLITGLTSAASPGVDISSTCKVGQKLGVSLPVDMLRFGVTIPATVPQRSEIPEGLTNYPVFS